MEPQERKANDAEKTKENVKPKCEDRQGVEHTVPYIPPVILRMKGLSFDDSKDLKENVNPTSAKDGGEGAIDVEEKERNDTKHQQKPRSEIEDDVLAREHDLVAQYVRDHSPVFCELAELRLKVWQHADISRYHSILMTENIFNLISTTVTSTNTNRDGAIPRERSTSRSSATTPTMPIAIRATNSSR